MRLAPRPDDAHRLLPRRTRGESHPLVALALLVLMGAVVGAAVGESRDAGDPVQSRLGERVELVELIHAEQKRVTALTETVDELSAEVAAVERDATADAGAANRVQAEFDELAVPAGLTAVHGPGVRVELDDALDGAVDGAGVNDVIIHEEDLQAVINALWAGGAEAVAVNGQRLLTTTSIRCVGNVLLLHGNTYSPPYRIEAVGDPHGMTDELERDPGASRFAEHAARFDLGFEHEALEQIAVPTVERLTTLRVAEPSRS